MLDPVALHRFRDVRADRDETLGGKRDRAGELHMVMGNAERQRWQHHCARVYRGGDPWCERMRDAIVGGSGEIWAMLLRGADRNQCELAVLLGLTQLERR